VGVGGEWGEGYHTLPSNSWSSEQGRSGGATLCASNSTAAAAAPAAAAAGMAGCTPSLLLRGKRGRLHAKIHGEKGNYDKNTIF
jgi:hypothetical protein